MRSESALLMREADANQCNVLSILLCRLKSKSMSLICAVTVE